MIRCRILLANGLSMVSIVVWRATVSQVQIMLCRSGYFTCACTIYFHTLMFAMFMYRCTYVIFTVYVVLFISCC